MKYLFHSSAYLHEELRPGFYYTQQEKRWDKFETNHFLYASSVKEDAVDQGFASAMEQRCQIDQYRSTSDGEILIRLNNLYPVSVSEIETIDIYLYRIRFMSQDGWMKNNNPNNNLSTEWKTNHVVPKVHIEKTITIPIGRILAPLIIEMDSVEIRFQKVQLDKMGLEALDPEMSVAPFYKKWQ